MDIDYIHEQCSRWIESNQYKRVILQFKKGDLKESVKVVDRIKTQNPALQIYVTQSNTCCIDLLVTQHVSNIDAIIHIGSVCLSKPFIRCDEINKPVFFVFQPCKTDIQTLLSEIQALSETKNRICIFYDTDLLDCIVSLEEFVMNSSLQNKVEISSLNCPLPHWQTIDQCRHKLTKDNVDDQKRLGCFVTKHSLDTYDCAIYIGQNLSIQIALGGPSELWQIKVEKSGALIKENVNVQKLLNKRMALVNRLKDLDELKIGIIITNPLPDIDDLMTKLEMYAKARKHVLYFISMVQTTDEYKIGNFDLCDAFVIANSCYCSSILESLVFNRPILTEHEFKLTCGFEAIYGRVLWPGSSLHLSEEDLINKRRVSDVSVALVHTRNELLERCSQARVNRWSGMEYKATSLGPDGETGGESLDIEEGLTGIASSYSSEPSNK